MSEYVKPVLSESYSGNQAIYNSGVDEEASWWVTYIRVDGRSWRIDITPIGAVCFLTACDQSKDAGRYVDSRCNTRAGVMALGQLLGALLLMLRQSGPSSSPEIWFDPESPAFGMAFRHVAKNPLVLEAFEREGYRLIVLGGEVARNENQSVTDPSG
ncbi:hypothetical protein [Spiribacter salilacus]|uniref:hypothetical protein n=1 Tax=Spiribacter salilacus TaxID=2664894 RepID=UPI001561FBD8|nr:hypothetical protein [Spiribacter salilacus]